MIYDQSSILFLLLPFYILFKMRKGGKMTVEKVEGGYIIMVDPLFMFIHLSFDTVDNSVTMF